MSLRCCAPGVMWPEFVLFCMYNSPVAPRGGGAKWGGALPKLSFLCPKIGFFFFLPKTAPEPIQSDKRQETVATTHMPMIALGQRALSCPRTPRYVRKTAKKCPKWPRLCAFRVEGGQNQ